MGDKKKTTNSSSSDKEIKSIESKEEFKIIKHLINIIEKEMDNWQEEKKEEKKKFDNEVKYQRQMIENEKK